MNAPLRYVSAQDVENGAAAYTLPVEGPDGRRLGRLDGFMIHEPTNRVRYLVVVNRNGWRLERTMVPFGSVQIDTDHGCVRLL